MADTIELGHLTKVGFKKQTNPWGGAPLVVGAGDGFEINSDSIKADASIAPNVGVFGSPFQRPGSPDKFLVAGDLVADLYYQDWAHRLLGMIFADAVTALGSGAHRHDLTMRTSISGIDGTLVIPGDNGVREYGSAKVTGVKLRWDEGDQRAKITATLACHDFNLNVGSPDDDFVVASVAAANGVLTILAPALAQFTPSPLFMTKVVGITTITVVFVCEDRWGNLYTKTITQADFTSEVWTDTTYVRKVVSATISNLAGTGNVKVGVTNGVNNASTIAAITEEASREVSLFSQLEFLINRQGAGAVAAATDEQFLKSLEIEIQLNTDQRVTSEFGNRISEPSLAGSDFAKVMVSIELSAHSNRNRDRLYDALQAGQLKAKATLTGAQIASSGVAHSIVVWLNGIQFPSADGPNVGGAGVQPVTFSGEAHLVAAVPTGFPSGADEPTMLQITNGLATVIV